MKRFPSIKKNTDFQTAFRKGRKSAAGLLLMYIVVNDLNYNRIGVVVSKKRGNSVERHHFIRQMREIFRFYDEFSEQGYDIVVVARDRVGNFSFSKIREYYEGLLVRFRILKDRDFII